MATSPGGACQREEEEMKILHWRRKKDDLLFRMQGMNLCVYRATSIQSWRHSDGCSIGLVRLFLAKKIIKLIFYEILYVYL